MDNSILSPEEIAALVSQLDQEEAGEDSPTGGEKVRESDGQKDNTVEEEGSGTEEAETRKVVFAPLESQRSARNISTMEEFSNLNFCLEIVLGEITLTVGELLNLEKDSVIVLNHLAGDNAVLVLNDKPLAEGEVVVLNDCFAMRINDIAGGGGSQDEQGFMEEEE